MRIRTGKRMAMVLALGLFGTLTTFAQDPQFTQFYANPLYLNPAFAGTARCPRVVFELPQPVAGFDRHFCDHQREL
jgi:hypothetical protein